MKIVGQKMYDWAVDLFPINRSITGNGVRKTLQYIKNIIPSLQIHEIPSGTQCFDWTIPKEWNCKEAYIITPDNKKICIFTQNNLHLVGYSIPINQEISYKELVKHLHYIENKPTAIPYVASYYKERWGFCLSYEEFQTLPQGTYKIVIDSELKNGFLTYGEVLIPGESEKEIFLSTYICHPSMANNELSGPVVTMALIKFIMELSHRKYSYRIIFIPETIGSICYLSRNLEVMQKNIIAGFNITTIGDNLTYSYLPTRYGNTLSDKVAQHILKNTPHKSYTFLQRGSDERQYCSPGVDLPIATICRSKYGTYPEYHTSLDNLDFISKEGLYGGYDKLAKSIVLLEKNMYYKISTPCEPQLGKRGLYPTVSGPSHAPEVRRMMNFIAYCDGTNDIIDIADIIGVAAEDLYDLIDKLKQNNLITNTKEIQ